MQAMTSPKIKNREVLTLDGAAFLVASFFCITFALAFGNKMPGTEQRGRKEREAGYHPAQ